MERKIVICCGSYYLSSIKLNNWLSLLTGDYFGCVVFCLKIELRYDNVCEAVY